MGAVSPRGDNVLLATGSQSSEAGEMTTLFVARGHLGQATSAFDRRVKAAVEIFQARHVDSCGRPLVDGKVGPLT